MLVRALIVLLLVLNLGVAAWWATRAPPPAPVAVEPALGVARLQLLGEATSRTPAATANVPATTTAATSAPPPPPTAPDFAALPTPQQCFAFGPFASKPAADAALAKLRPQVQSATAREEVVATAARGWRVFLPPLASLEEAQATAQRIAAAGFDDFLIVREGVEANSIALGRYRSEEGARKRAEALVAAGFAARTAALGEEGAAKAAWLEVIADEAFDPTRAQAAIGAAQRRKLDCTTLR
ncbi:MAG TPA: SPOR domain-containing protein [Lysobacter sp.]